MAYMDTLRQQTRINGKDTNNDYMLLESEVNEEQNK